MILTDLLTTVSGNFNRSLILGAFLPMIIFTTFFLLTAYPLFPENFPIFSYLNSLESEWMVIAIAFLIIVLSAVLFIFNNPLIRIYEGYPWRDSWYGKKLIKNKQQAFSTLQTQANGWRTLLIFLKKADDTVKKDTIKELKQSIGNTPWSIRKSLKEDIDAEDLDAIKSSINDKWTALHRQLRVGYPPRKSLILPTKVGNVVRSFESYSDSAYGIDSITLYPRLIAKIDSDYRAFIENAKTSFDFMINSSILSGVLALILLFVGVGFGKPFMSNWELSVWLGEVSLFIFLFFLFYKGAINQAYAWGEAVKSSFDLFRNDLLKQLGFEYVPKTKDEENLVWDKISRYMLDGSPRKGHVLSYQKEKSSSPPTYAKGEGEDTDITVLKTFEVKDNLTCKVFLEVCNSTQDTINAVKVFDTLLPDWGFQSKSAQLYEHEGGEAQTVEVSGINPYWFLIGDLQANQKKWIQYQIIRLGGENR